MGAFSAWRIHDLADGELFVPPEGLKLAAIRIRCRVRPVVSLHHLCDKTIARLEPRLRDITRQPPERLITFEGEDAFIVDLSGIRRRDGARVDFVVAVVLGDDFYERIDAYCTDHRQVDDFRVSMRGFVREHRLQLGSVRARRFEYQPPPDWVGRARGLRAEWFPVDYPRHATRICVHPAVPCQQPFSAIEAVVGEEWQLRGLEPLRRAATTRLTSDDGLNGVLWRMSGMATRPVRHEIETIVAALLDDRFLYLMRLETTPRYFDADRALFLSLVQSARPVPVRPPIHQSDAVTFFMARTAS